MPSTQPLPLPLRVAVVEDEPAFRSAFVSAIAAAPDLQLVGVATTRTEGLALLRGLAADVMLVDIGLPDGSGIDVMRAVQREWPGCCTLVTTVFGDEQHVIQAIQAGAEGYLLKDSDAPDVVEEIRNVARGGSPISPLIARRVMQLLRGQAPQPLAASSAGEPSLSTRETEVLQLVSRGFTQEEIAQRLGISRHTVLTFVRRIYAKLEVNSKMEAVNEARRKGLLQP